MEIQMNDNSIVEMLETIFSNVNSWLNFAEAKNAALMAYSNVSSNMGEYRECW